MISERPHRLRRISQISQRCLYRSPGTRLRNKTDKWEAVSPLSAQHHEQWASALPPATHRTVRLLTLRVPHRFPGLQAVRESTLLIPPPSRNISHQPPPLPTNPSSSPPSFPPNLSQRLPVLPSPSSPLYPHPPQPPHHPCQLPLQGHSRCPTIRIGFRRISR